MTETVHVYAGECTTTYNKDGDATHQRGRVVVIHKPDGTVLVHDSQGYQPVEWLTRANAVHREQGEDGSFALVAVKDHERLRVESQSDGNHARYDATPAGIEVGTCPDCAGMLVHARGAVTCLDCPTDYGLPGDATVLDSTCECGLPQMAVERGTRFELCIDRNCEGLDEAVRERFDREWSCPNCDGDLRVLRERSLFLGCENYPDCESSFALPNAEVVGTCKCGLPQVRAGEVQGNSASQDDPRCLDPDCDETPEAI